MKKLLTLFLAVTLSLSPMAVCVMADEAATDPLSVESISSSASESAEELYTASYELSDGLTFTRRLTYDSSYGSEREYSLTYTPGSDTRIAFVNGEYLYQTATVKNLAAYEYPEENYVAGINADFFNMSTGVPESAYIKDGELYTTDRDSFCLAEAGDGHYFIDKPQIKLLLTSDTSGIEYNILHLNKEFSEYGLYLYNAHYSPTTHISAQNTAVVLCPYTERFTKEEMLELLIQVFAEETDEEEPAEVEVEADAETDIEPKTETNIETEIIEALSIELEAYLSAEQDGEDADALLDALCTSACSYFSLTQIGELYYQTTAPYPHIGSTEKVVAVSIDPEAANESIPENAYLLCADNSSYGYTLMAMNAGDTFTLRVDGNPSFYDVKNAVGTGTVIVRDSTVIDDRTFSHYMSAQPRSAVGIRADGSLVFYAVDGRQKNYSAGLKLYDLGERMLALGCVYAANLDGGGSTVVHASLPGNDSATAVSSPSGGYERRVSNGVAFTDTAVKTGVASAAYAYGDYYLTLSDTPISLGELVLSDENGFAVEMEEPKDTETAQETENTEDTDENAPFILYTKDGASMVENGVLNPCGQEGVIEVFASLDGGQTENLATTVVSLAEPDTIELTADKTAIAPFETVTLSAAALYRKLHVESSLNSYTWTLSDENGDSSEALGTLTDGVFTPLADGTDVTVTASRGTASGEVTIRVAAYPFVDIREHWAVKEIYALAADGIVNGELDADGIPYYLPERTYSRNEFIVMVERLTGIGSELELPTEEEQTAVLADAASVPEWAHGAVWRLQMSGLLEDILHRNENAEPVLDGALPITRGEVISVIGKICDPIDYDFSLDGFSDLSELEKMNDSIKNAVAAGIFSGYDDGTLRLSAYLTRAEGAAVFVRLQKHLSESVMSMDSISEE